MRLLVLVAVSAAVLLGAPPAVAHPMPHSVVLLDVREASVDAELRLPAGELATASGIDLDGADLPVDALRTYLIAHFRPVTPAGEPWRVELKTAEQTAAGTYREIVARAALSPPAGGDVRHFTLGYDVIVHQVVTHVALVSVRRDWASGQVGGDTAELGTVRIDARSMTVPALTVDLGGGSAWRGFVAMVRLGGEHLLAGTDHLLFLLILLLPATLRAVGGRWREPVSGRAALGGVGRTTLAFTLGHSVALAVSTLGHLELPPGPVEAFIAASILVGAVHAVRPLFPGREALVAGVFGLGHGMAFSFTLAELQLSTGRLALSLLGFNAGLELVQLLLVALALPTLMVLARSPAQSWLRVTAAVVTAMAAAAWLLDRLGVPNAAARVADAAGAHPQGILAGLVVTAALTATWRRRIMGGAPR